MTATVSSPFGSPLHIRNAPLPADRPPYSGVPKKSAFKTNVITVGRRVADRAAAPLLDVRLSRGIASAPFYLLSWPRGRDTPY
jgi:hypothetical protein